MIKFPLENATPYYLADTTTSTTDTLENQNDDVVVGDVVDVDGKKAIDQSKAFAIVASINGAVNGKVINRHFSAFSAGRVWVKTSSKPEIGSDAHYNASTKDYGTIGDIVVGTFLTSNDDLNVVQVSFPKSNASGDVSALLEALTEAQENIETLTNELNSLKGSINSASSKADAADGKAVTAQTTANEAKAAAAAAQETADQALANKG